MGDENVDGRMALPGGGQGKKEEIGRKCVVNENMFLLSLELISDAVAAMFVVVTCVYIAAWEPIIRCQSTWQTITW